MVRQARVLNPEIRIVARTAFLSELEDLRDAGVDVIFSDEGEVALSVTELILKQFGATPEQIDRERARVHEKLFFPVMAEESETNKNWFSRLIG